MASTLDREDDGGPKASLLDPDGTQTCCPQCKSTTPWGSASWCPDCGYYPIAANHQKVNQTISRLEDKIEEEPQSEPLVPTWNKILFAGCAAIFVLNMGIRLHYYYHEGDLGLIAILELALGVICILAAQCWAALVAMKRNAKLTLMDGITSPVEIWNDTIQNLPAGHWKVSLAVWGVCGVTASFTVLGGFDIERFFGKVELNGKKPKLVKEVADLAATKPKGEKEEGDLEDALDQFADEAGVSEIDQAQMGEQLAQYTIYGYMTDGRTKPARILVASRLKGRLRHVAAVPFDSLPESMQAMFATSLPLMRLEKTDVATSFQAQWVRPVLQLPIKSDGQNPDGTLINPKFVGPDPSQEPAGPE